MAALTIVPTPVGNLNDITLRALDVLKNCDVILAEDTRTTSVLLKHFAINTPMLSHHKFNEHKTVEHLVKRMLGGTTMALVSDAGTPCISDPGFMLVRQCVAEGVSVECLPGATAFVPALVVSGLPSDRFHFEGFLPVKKGRQTRLIYLATLPETLVLYESPFRVLKTLTQLVDYFGADRPASASREISKQYEETVRGTLSDLVQHFTAHEPRGEFVLVIAGAHA